MEAAIVSGLKRPGSERQVRNDAVGSLPALSRAALRAAGLAGRVAAWWRRSLWALTEWAARRSVAPTSLAGISVLLALCSAAWLSGGQGMYTLRGAVAVCGWYAARFAARQLAVYRARRPVSPPQAQRSRRAVQRASALGGSTDWLALPVLNWDDGRMSAAGSGAAAGAETERSRAFGWLAAICTVAAECAIYGGMAAGGLGRDDWLLAVLTIAAIAVTETITACRAGPAAVGPAAAARGRGFWRVADLLVAPSAGWRVLIAMVLLAAAGERIALFAVLAIEVVSVCWVIAAVSFGWPTARFTVPASRDVLVRCRDDGPAARWAGRLVQGGLLPLPPVFAGLVATALLVALASRSLPGFVAMTPPVVMMLAAPGSSHPHDGRSDWLVPGMLAVAQYVYLVAVGFAANVSGALVFAACAVLAVWLASRAAAGSPPTAAGIGWEGRMFVVGLAGILGIEVFGYLGLAVLLGVLTCRNIAGRYLVPSEAERR